MARNKRAMKRQHRHDRRDADHAGSLVRCASGLSFVHREIRTSYALQAATISLSHERRRARPKSTPGSSRSPAIRRTGAESPRGRHQAGEPLQPLRLRQRAHPRAAKDRVPLSRD